MMTSLYINTPIKEFGSTKSYERISTDERSIVNTHSIGITAKCAVDIKENQGKPYVIFVTETSKTTL